MKIFFLPFQWSYFYPFSCLTEVAVIVSSTNNGNETQLFLIPISEKAVIL